MRHYWGNQIIALTENRKSEGSQMKSNRVTSVQFGVNPDFNPEHMLTSLSVCSDGYLKKYFFNHSKYDSHCIRTSTSFQRIRGFIEEPFVSY